MRINIFKYIDILGDKTLNKHVSWFLSFDFACEQLDK